MPQAERLRRTVHLLTPPVDEPDTLLLARFARTRDEPAFAELVRRHGPMVFAVCRRVLGQDQDAEDACQAAFLVLARRAGAVCIRGSVGDWLHGVARRTALAVRRAATRRRAREARVVLPSPVPTDDLVELWGVLDEELARLPEAYRAVLVLADLEGKDRRQVAAELGIPEGTVASRQARARDLLARRLSRRGWGLPGYLAGVAPVAVPATLGAATARRAAGFVSGATVGNPETLARGVVAAMTRKKLVLAAVAVAAVVTIGGGLTGLAAGPDGGPGAREAKGYSVATTGSGAVLLDPATGETWILSQPPGGEPAWVPVRKPTRSVETAKPAPKPADARPAAPPLEVTGNLTLTRSFRVTPRTAGVVARVHVRAGDEVKAGTLLVGLDDTDARLGLEAAEAAASVAEAKTPPGNAAIPEMMVRQREAEVRRARVEIARAKAALDATRLLAPADGTVIQMTVAPGDAVGPGGPAVVIASLRDLEAAAQLAEAGVGRVTVGQTCVVRVGAAGKEYPGVVTGMSAVLDPTTATATVRAKVLVPDGQPAPRAGSFATLRFNEK
ncbi:MAG: sigE 15 [Gemmataceae bacterium]|nr:sigE 15 [Gemmataceae bacterium]